MTASRADDIEAVRAVVTALHHAADLRDWEWFGNCVTDSFCFDGTMIPREQLLEAQRGRAAAAGDILTQHQLTSMHIALDGDSAQVMSCQTIQRHRRGVVQPPVSVSGSRNRYVVRLTEQGWRVADARIEVLWSEGDLGG